ncbi:MAG TPA: enoyl-CoA hydratase-related protein [Acidimicrobiia bacterium]|nr:enoyl-CoA hydratase-related protein [Acidimicrobiia bacterium]
MPVVVVDRPEAHITRITLNRPDRLNAMDHEFVARLHDALDDVSGDADTRVVILRGAGKGFSSGLDLQDWGPIPSPGEHPHARVGVGFQEFIANLTQHVRQTPQIVVAAVHGAAYGGGLALACAADLRIAARSARFCSAFIRTGLTGTDIGISYLLPRLIGAGRALDMIVTGREVDAVEAERMGLVTRLVADDELEDAALELARGMAGFTATGLVLTKEVFWHNVETPTLAAALAMENRNQTIAGRTPEVQEYIAAYRTRFTHPREG